MTERKDGVRKLIQCPCGFSIEADGDEALVARAQEHARREHGMELHDGAGPRDGSARLILREGGRDDQDAAVR